MPALLRRDRGGVVCRAPLGPHQPAAQAIASGILHALPTLQPSMRTGTRWAVWALALARCGATSHAMGSHRHTDGGHSSSRDSSNGATGGPAANPVVDPAAVVIAGNGTVRVSVSAATAYAHIAHEGRVAVNALGHVGMHAHMHKFARTFERCAVHGATRARSWLHSAACLMRSVARPADALMHPRHAFFHWPRMQHFLALTCQPLTIFDRGHMHAPQHLCVAHGFANQWLSLQIHCDPSHIGLREFFLRVD